MSHQRVYVIAEAGVNHNGSLETARQLVKAAADCGAVAVKFQTFKADRIVTKTADKADYQIRNTGTSESQWEMLKRLELNDEAHYELLDLCKSLGIDFLSSPFDDSSAEFLSKTLGLTLIKIPSGEITNAPMLRKIAETGASLILSTGMCTLGEIEQALAVIASGYAFPSEEPTPSSFYRAFCSAEGQEA